MGHEIKSPPFIENMTRKCGLLPLAENPYRHGRKGNAKNSDFFARNLPGQKLQFSVRASMSYFGDYLGLAL